MITHHVRTVLLLSVTLGLTPRLLGARSGGDGVADSMLPAAQVVVPDGPTYLAQSPGPASRPTWSAVVAGRGRRRSR